MAKFVLAQEDHDKGFVLMINNGKLPVYNSREEALRERDAFDQENHDKSLKFRPYYLEHPLVQEAIRGFHLEEE